MGLPMRPVEHLSSKEKATPLVSYVYNQDQCQCIKLKSFFTPCGLAGDSRNKTRPAKVVVVANSKQKVFSWTQLVVKYTSKNFGYDYTLYCVPMLH